jgi:hypothetical protein
MRFQSKVIVILELDEWELETAMRSIEAAADKCPECGHSHTEGLKRRARAFRDNFKVASMQFNQDREGL